MSVSDRVRPAPLNENARAGWAQKNFAVSTTVVQISQIRDRQLFQQRQVTQSVEDRVLAVMEPRAPQAAKRDDEVWTRSGLVRIVVLFVIKLSTRRVEIAGVCTQPDGAWMTQISRNLTDAAHGK